jgi:hypothetical protein
MSRVARAVTGCDPRRRSTMTWIKQIVLDAPDCRRQQPLTPSMRINRKRTAAAMPMPH